MGFLPDCFATGARDKHLNNASKFIQEFSPMAPTRQDTNSLAGLLNGIEQCEIFVRDLAAVILQPDVTFESVWDVTNRVYERSYKRMALVQRGRPQPEQMALSA